MPVDQIKYRISGHETFALRYAWLPKCVKAVAENSYLFADEDKAMVVLGVGKNMVRAIRFWGEMTGAIESRGRGKDYAVSEFGRTIFDPSSGLDPFLEDDQTLWLLHWRLTTRQKPLFAWDFLLNHWHEPELVPSVLISAGKRELEKEGISLAESSLRSHFSVFFHSYYSAKSLKGSSEESLDSPLVELGLVEFRCKRTMADGKLETVYAFRRGKKPEVTDRLFVYAVLDYWKRTCPGENTLSFRQIAHGVRSPGQVFKLGESDMRERMERVWTDEQSPISYTGTSLIQSLHRHEDLTDELMAQALAGIYSR